MCENEKLLYIIRSRIKDYEQDIEVCKTCTSDVSSRLTQDKAIVGELYKLLTGMGLEKLSYVS